MNYSDEIATLTKDLSQALNRIEQLEKLFKNNTIVTSSSKAEMSGDIYNTKSTTKSTKPFDNKVYLSTKSNSHYVSGNTYNIRSILKEKGATWEGTDKCWKIKKETISLDDISQLIEAQGICVEMPNNKLPSSTSRDKSSNNKKNKSSKKEILVKTTENVKINNNNGNGNGNDDTPSGFAFLSDSDDDSD